MARRRGQRDCERCSPSAQMLSVTHWAACRLRVAHAIKSQPSRAHPEAKQSVHIPDPARLLLYVTRGSRAVPLTACAWGRPPGGHPPQLLGALRSSWAVNPATRRGKGKPGVQMTRRSVLFVPLLQAPPPQPEAPPAPQSKSRSVRLSIPEGSEARNGPGLRSPRPAGRVH